MGGGGGGGRGGLMEGRWMGREGWSYLSRRVVVFVGGDGGWEEEGEG